MPRHLPPRASTTPEGPATHPVVAWDTGSGEGAITSPILALTAVAAVAVALAALWVIAARRSPQLEPWHTIRLQREFTAVPSAECQDLESYLHTENHVFAEVDLALESTRRADRSFPLCRFEPDGRNNPSTFPVNWNRSFIMTPKVVRGGVLLLHGLTDSPYTLRRIGQILVAQGLYVLGLRLPGHGTIPAGINQCTRRDWIAAVRIGANHVCSQLNDHQPFWIVGYSNGGTLALDYSLTALEDGSRSGIRMPRCLVLFSPALGVSRAAAFARWHRSISSVPGLERLAWHTIYPEHDPFKYNSFPSTAGYETHRLIDEVLHRLVRYVRKGRSGELPRILTFQSLADATVSTEAVIEDLYLQVAGPHDELVVFDVNRVAYMADFFASDPARALESLQAPVDFKLTMITNTDRTSRSVVERCRGPGAMAERVRPLDLEWPLEVYSMSHVSLPFSPDDPIYGRASDELPPWGVPLGSVEPRGERHLLSVPMELFMRLRHNPFFPYIEQRLIALAETDLPPTTECEMKNEN